MSWPAAAPASVAATRPNTPSAASSLPTSCSSAAASHARVAGVRRAGQLAPPRRARPRSRGAGRGSACARHSAKLGGREHRSDPRDVVGTRRARPQRAEEATGRGARRFIGSSATNTKSNSAVDRTGRGRADHAGPEHDQEQHEDPVGPEPVPVPGATSGQRRARERRAVERRDRQQVEQAEQQVDRARRRRGSG